MTALLLILAAVLSLVPTLALAIAIPRMGDQPDQSEES